MRLWSLCYADGTPLTERHSWFVSIWCLWHWLFWTPYTPPPMWFFLTLFELFLWHRQLGYLYYNFYPRRIQHPNIFTDMTSWDLNKSTNIWITGCSFMFKFISHVCWKEVNCYVLAFEGSELFVFFWDYNFCLKCADLNPLLKKYINNSNLLR